MKTIVICPGHRPRVPQLFESAPLAALQFLGEPLLAWWLAHLAAQGVREVTVLACDRPAAIRAVAGTGARWGLRVRFETELRELTPAEARQRYRQGDGWMPEPTDAVVIDHLPGRPECRLFESYAGWFEAVQAWLASPSVPYRVGAREIAPGVRVGWGSRVAPDAKLLAPCWIGEKVIVGAGATIGPKAVVEDRAVVEPGAEVTRSIVGPETLVGGLTEIGDSLAFGDTLVNWRDGSCLQVPEEFLLCPLRPRETPPPETAGWFTRVARTLRSATPFIPSDPAALRRA